ncbi:hypothetical protein QJS10_CPA06g01197 [Acorus calamus]|uniref:Uncharacterized protein n=1 Tax=Acorus calamus TaxID=4465 RepID=A0AAV9EM14_ACOCL|nr:hypothetical protein QJS10_CPA06g01197 [Acorus calamus]
MLATRTLTHILPKPTTTIRLLSSKTPYPYYYHLVNYRPVAATSHRKPQNPQPPSDPSLDRSKRKYLRKRSRRMYGSSSSSDDDGRSRRAADEMVELKPEVVELKTLHQREEELHFYDAFAYPWEKDRHYRMVYRLEKKYFPDQCLDKAFSEEEAVVVGGGEKGLVFFDVGKEAEGEGVEVGGERKVEEFFKDLKKVSSPGEGGGGGGEAYLATRRTGLPPRWDGPHGTVVLVDKPKGEERNRSHGSAMTTAPQWMRDDLMMVDDP